jgi:tetratricopeptide (TPR) repeat protein
MNRFCLLPFLAVIVLALSGPSGADQDSLSAKQTKMIALNNEGVQALDEKRWQLAMSKFAEALSLNPEYDLARENLALAHHNYGLTLISTQPSEALKEFYDSLYLRLSMKVIRKEISTSEAISSILINMGKDPKSFAVRVQLGDDAKLRREPESAIVEYYEALQLKNDPEVHRKLGETFKQVGQIDKAKAEYEAAGVPVNNIAK